VSTTAINIKTSDPNTMAEAIRRRVTKIQEGAKAKTKPAGWILPKQKTSFSEENDW
jgi:NCS1 family nucleobase:cation symporter-1